ncbi:hypothetical protein GPECTOR_1g298 [Gonium pectorale]|uniref:DNA ligase n=1 Tax=Gonium pectorale TaxID=33097 RepID=A0A150H2E2_GONPE|nr:hypothetical protein GPECTOR_1g298 [Gonium pectorale]|eukprot:KXZ56337.1 hypothetical protein GPECTOR_1g298 [Gonium pectorale]
MKQISIGAYFTSSAKPAAKGEATKGKNVTDPPEEGPAPARKRLRRTVIEDDEDEDAQAKSVAPVVTPGDGPKAEDVGDVAMAEAAPAEAAPAEAAPAEAAPAEAPPAEAAPPATVPAASASAEAALAEQKPAAQTEEERENAGAGSAPSQPSTSRAPLASIFQRPAARKATAAGSPSAAAARGGKTPPSAGPSKGAAAKVAKGKVAAAGSTKTTAEEPAAKASEADLEDADVESSGDGEDPISDSDEDAGGDVNAILPEGAGAAKKNGAKKKAAAKGAKGDKMDGVGTGALAAAAKYAEADFRKLINWKEGAPVPYKLLADTFEEIAETTKRLEIVALLVSAFRAILATNPKDLLPAIYLCVNRVAPAHTGIELGIGEATLIKALCEATGKNEASIKKAYETNGDLGVVAVGAKSTQRMMCPPPPLTIAGVLKAFQNIAQASGSKSQDQKRGMIVKLLVAAKGNEPGYIVRSLQAKLRIGLAEQSVLVALAHAVHLHREGVKDRDGRLAERLEAAAQVVKQAYSECPTYDVLVPALLENGSTDLLSRCHFMPGVPVKPMLAKATNGVSEVLEKFTDQEFTVEYKYDGERAQVHVLDSGKTVHIFSRNAENNTPKYPDIVARLRGLLQPHVQSIVFDSEAVAYDPEKKKILPFQVLSTRARKDVNVGEIKVQVVLFAFDCLYLNGESMLHKPLTERRAALYSALIEKEGELQYASYKTSRNVEELENFLTESVEAGTEGLIVKTLADTYEPSKRSSHWLKLKKDYMEGVGDTFDVVPLGGFFGKGKRTGVFGAYLLGIYDPDTESYQTISKLGTGFSEEQLTALADSMRPHIIQQPRPYYKWSENLVPDVWFDAVAVWEVKAADLSISPVHKAAVGLVDPSKGISIRFPRLIRVRDDKSPEDATSAAQVVDMYRSQAVIKQQQAAKQKEQDDDEE